MSTNSECDELTSFFLNLIASLRLAGVKDIANNNYAFKMGCKAAYRSCRKQGIIPGFPRNRLGWWCPTGMDKAFTYGVLGVKSSIRETRLTIELRSKEGAEDYISHHGGDPKKWKIAAERFLLAFNKFAQ
jgi:hypothetical protein